MIHRELLIAGHFVGGECDRSVGKLVIKSPWDGSVVGTAAEGGWQEMNTAIDSARDAAPLLRDLGTGGRQGVLKAIAAVVRDRSAELAQLLTNEVGKPLTWSEGEVSRVALTFDLAAHELNDWGPKEVDLTYDPRGLGYSGSYDRFPRGVVLGIVPYNWPLNLAAHKIAPALATGNAIVIKPSSLAPLSTLSLARLIHEAGCPHGALNAVTCPSPIAERAAKDSRVDMVSFTGSPTVGWHLKGILPAKPVALELGGDGYAVVCDDADIEWAAQRVVSGAFGYAGQICISVQHVLVQSKIYPDFRNRIIELTKSCEAGDPRLKSTVCGPLISDEAADKVADWIAEAVALGGNVLVGGKRTDRLITPTLVEDTPAQSRLATDEVFGPVLTISRFEEFEQAIQRVNQSDYGIHCGVFTNDRDRQRIAYESIAVGGVVINDFPTLRFDSLPYGGVRRSGFGREGVRFAMEEMTELRSLVVRRGTG